MENRTIKFRGMRIEDNHWVEGDLVQHRGKTFIAYEYHEAPSHHDPGGCDIEETYEVYPASVGQFTGLLDKAGREIYEGDLLNIGAAEFGWITNDKEENVSYEVKTEGCDYVLNRSDLPINWGRLSRVSELCWQCVIIGNTSTTQKAD